MESALRKALDMALEASLDLELLAQNAGVDRARVEEFSTHLDVHRRGFDSDEFFADVYRSLGHELRTVADVHALIDEDQRNLRTIAVFGVGDLEKAKTFCRKVTDLRIAMQWRDHHDRRARRFLAA